MPGRAEIEEPTPERVADMVRSLAEVMHQSNVTELDLALGGLSVRLRRSGNDLIGNPDGPSLGVAVRDQSPVDREHVISAPMIGTFYASSTPGSPPFITEGDEIVVGQTIGIIEAMKIMNEIVADRSGIVTAILVENGQPVEYGFPLARVSPSQGARP